MTIKDQVQDEVLHVTLLGEFRLAWGETAVSGINNPIYQSLLAYLILNRNQIHTRRHLAYQFWPDSTETQARTNLRKAIYYLRHYLPCVELLLQLERHQIRWKPDAPVFVDVVAFSTAVSQAEKAMHPADQKACLMQAIDCYHDDLLIGHYDDWVLTAREQLRQKYFSSLATLIRLLEEEHGFDSAISYAQQLLSADPLHEEAYRRLMRLQAENGRIAAALRTYHTCNTTLQNELGVSPSPATQALYEQLLNTNVPKIIPTPARTPLIAREDAWNTLQTAWQQAQRGPQLALISGEAGIGKTRLAEELLHWTARQGVTTITSACYAAQGQLPFAPITTWLRTDSMQKRISRLNDKWLIELARLLPELLAERPDLNPPGPLTEGWQRQHFFTALVQAVQLVRSPLLLCIDDLQWCDSDTLDWLHFLLRFDGQAHFLLLGTVRSEEVDANQPLKHWRQHVCRDHVLFEIKLKRFDQAETCVLAEQIVQRELAASKAEWLYAETEGNPLFVVEMVRSGLQRREIESSVEITSLPDKVRLILEMRLAQLSSSARELCELAATIGRSFTFDLLAAACNQDEESLVTSLDELWQRRIVRERGTDEYDFSHDKLRQAAYSGLSQARKRLLHSRIIKALKTLHTDNLDQVSGQLAAHFEATYQMQEAIQYYQRAAQISNRVFAHQDTMRYLRRAIALLPKANIEAHQQVELYELLGDVLALTGEDEGAREMFETAVSHTQDTIRQSQLYRKIADTWHARHFNLEKALQVLEIAEITLGEPGETTKASWWQEWSWIQIARLWVFYLIRSNEKMSQLAEQIRPVLDEYGLPIQRGIYLLRLAMLAFHQERMVVTNETVHLAQAALAALEPVGQRSQIGLARFFVGMVHLWYGWAGKLEEAETHMQIALKEAEEIGDVVLQSRCLCYLLHNYRRRGEIEKVKEILPRARAVAEKATSKNYVFQSYAHEAWVAWREGNLEQVQEFGQVVLDNQHFLPNTPFRGAVLWPLIGAALCRDDIETAVGFAPKLLDPNQKRMPEALTNLLQQAISAWEADQPETARTYMQQSLKQAQEMSYL